MSNMLEQAIADAAALREQAIKNAEQSVLDKYSKQIKEAVDQMLEMDDAPNKANEIISEVEEELMEQEEAPAMAEPAADAGGQPSEPPLHSFWTTRAWRFSSASTQERSAYSSTSTGVL